MKELVKNIVGNVLLKIMPKRADKIAREGMTINLNLTKVDLLIKNALLKQAEKSNDFETLSEFHFNYWNQKGKEYFEGQFNNDTLNDFFIPNCSFLLDLLQKELEKKTEHYSMLVEIGTGDGTVLEYLSTRFPQIDRLVGIDLCELQIDKNKKTFKANPNLEFVASDGIDWIIENGQPNMIIFTSRGVLEYFTALSLQKFFRGLSKIGNVIFMAIEPTAVGHDFSKNPNSQIYGFEKSFSHNYIKLFKESNFNIWHHSTIPYSKEINFNFIGASN
ncbi:hypothetical protein MHTCC0001_33960 [Flavobacteriaceae bacterium MHTCC 0001]